MKKLRRVGILVAVVMLVVVVVYLFEKNTDEPEKIFVIPVNSDELFISSEEGYNSIKVYRQANVLVINALSEAAFFDGGTIYSRNRGGNNTRRCRNHLDDYRWQYGICRRQ